MVLRAQDKEGTETPEMSFLRPVLRTTAKDKMESKDTRERLQSKGTVQSIQKHKWK
jgi:hypothetical protein